ncbi:hypothetical protein E2562_004367 [Oryza meyeriana var. granulata]|uniref:Exportin-5 C-terminal domain-containing protein n=1 Tax=Oryza meyeriana var. granulata TaxID=110450 RepID=A0A6G1CZ62_9ORYZ|nr:hypothetical protein E2562_004367 [Oryza meyeriana var. granulata]
MFVQLRAKTCSSHSVLAKIPGRLVLIRDLFICLFVLAIYSGLVMMGITQVHMEENYVDALVSASLRMVRKGLPVEVQCLGLRMVQHLVYFRKKELSSTQYADLRKVLVGSLDDLVLKDATTVSDNPMGSTANPKENNKHKRCLLVVLAVNINLRSLAAMETDSVIGKVGEGNLSPLSNITSNSARSSDRSSGIWNETSCSSVFEDCDYVPFMNYPGSISDIINACKEFVEVAEPAMLVNAEMMSSHQKNASLLLMEHNVISQAFLAVISYSGIHQHVELIPCLLSLLNKIWTLPEWRSEYLQHGSGLTCLFSDGQFLKMVHYVVRFCEVKIRRDCTKVFTASKSCEPCIVTFVWLILPLILELLQCIHWLWNSSIAYTLSEVLERAKYPDASFQFEHKAKLFLISDREGSQEKDTRELIEGIRESGYSVIGLCASIEGAFSWLLNRTITAALLSDLASLEFRHLGKLIKLTVIPLVKNCPRKFWKELVDNFLGKLLRLCASILHSAWFELLHRGRAGASYYFGKLSGVEGRIKTLERDILLEFTHEVSGLLEVIALTEQSRELSLEDKVAISFQDSMPSTSLLRYLVINDCFGFLRMSLFGYFVDDASTAKAIPFCHALVCLAVGSNDARLRIFILDNLLPCLIQHLDSKLPCAIRSLKFELSSSGSDNASKGLVVLCQELYGYMLNCGYVQTQALIGGDKNGDDFQNSFEVWLGWQKENFRAKACSAASRELSFGYLWKWEFEDECHRYLSLYIDMLLEVDATSEFEEDIYADKACLFEKLRPEFRDKYAINSHEHPYMRTISSIQCRKFYSMAPVLHKRKICNLVHQLIKLKPYIKVSDYRNGVIYRLKRNSEIPAEFSDCVLLSVELLLSVLFFWEPIFHPMIREVTYGT